MVALFGLKKLSPTEIEAVRGAGSSETPVAANVTGDPVTPLPEACKLLGPASGPSVHWVDAIPELSVVEEAGFTLPPPAETDQETVLPETPLPPRATSTTSGFASACPGVAL
jgi:hypothetical protein